MTRAHPATEALRLASADVWRRALPATLRDVVARTDVTPSNLGFELREEPGGPAYAITH